MNDNTDNVTFLNFNTKSRESVEETIDETVQSFTQAADEIEAYERCERTTRAIVHGIVRVSHERISNMDENFYSDSAVISTLVFAMLARQEHLMTPEVALLDELKEAMTSKNGENL
jgi:hypothetical protein